MRAPSWPHSARPFDHFAASAAANASGVWPARRASSASTHGAKSAGGESREGEQQVAEVAFRIDRDHGHAVDRRFFDQVDAKAGLAAAGHAGDHGMRDEVRRIVKKRRVAAGLGVRVDLTAEVEQAELFEIGH